MSMPLSLESFEEALADETAASVDYNRGYEEGLAAGTAAAEIEIAAQNAVLVQTIADIEFTYAEARGQLLQSLNPLFIALTEHVLPSCIDAGFVASVVDRLRSAAENDTDAQLALHVHPDKIDEVTNLAAGLEAQLTIRPDADLTAHAAWVLDGQTETFLDADALLSELKSVLAAISNIDDRIQVHG